MPPTPQRTNPFFRLVIPACTVFIVTIFAMVAVPFGNPNAPPARFLDEYAGTLIAYEVAAILVLGLSALFLDRRQSLRNDHDQKHVEPSPPEKQENIL
ncbi:MAG: hypothetical protein IID46_07050 [Planctomycetes bacterium]|nr:hypothetical protein [Planctomycetota bacterium]